MSDDTSWVPVCELVLEWRPAKTGRGSLRTVEVRQLHRTGYRNGVNVPKEPSRIEGIRQLKRASEGGFEAVVATLRSVFAPLDVCANVGTRHYDRRTSTDVRTSSCDQVRAGHDQNIQKSDRSPPVLSASQVVDLVKMYIFCGIICIYIH